MLHSSLTDICTHSTTHTHTLHNTHTRSWVSLLLNTLPTWQPIALLVKSFPIGCIRIRFHFKEPAGSRATRHRRENITLVFRESRREWGDDRQKRWIDIDGGCESAGKGRSVVISLSNITLLLSLSCALSHLFIPPFFSLTGFFSPHFTSLFLLKHVCSLTCFYFYFLINLTSTFKVSLSILIS